MSYFAYREKNADEQYSPSLRADSNK